MLKPTRSRSSCAGSGFKRHERKSVLYGESGYLRCRLEPLVPRVLTLICRAPQQASGNLRSRIRMLSKRAFTPVAAAQAGAIFHAIVHHLAMKIGKLENQTCQHVGRTALPVGALLKLPDKVQLCKVESRLRTCVHAKMMHP